MTLKKKYLDNATQWKGVKGKSTGDNTNRKRIRIGMNPAKNMGDGKK